MAPFLKGLREAGASVELYYAKRLDVKPCMGEFHCWNKEPGVCYQRDDMHTLYPKLREADILVLATPVYIPLPGEMQNLINRLCPLLEPILAWRDDRTRAQGAPGFAVSFPEAIIVVCFILDVCARPLLLAIVWAYHKAYGHLRQQW